MNLIGIHSDKAIDQSVRVDFQYFIQSAIDQKLSWDSLVHFLTDLAPTLEKSRQVIQILVQELEKWAVSSEVFKFQDEGKKSVHEISDPFEPNQDGNDDQIVNQIEKEESVIEEIQLDKTVVVVDEIDTQVHEYFEDEKPLDDFEEIGTTPTEKKKFKCTYCPKIFSQNSNLVNHKKIIHSKKEQFKCNTCDKQFYWSYKLKSHERIHLEKQTEPEVMADTY